MAFLRSKAKEYGQLCLLFVGFLTGIGLVVTCGGGGGSGQQLPTSTSGTISFTPLSVDGAGELITGALGSPTPGSVNIDVPPALFGVTNVQDALNRLNVILSPDLARVTDPFTSLNDRVVDENLPAFLKDPDTGEPLTFSRALRGLVRATSLSGVLKADDAFILSCNEVDPMDPNMDEVQEIPYVYRSFCRDTDVGGGTINGIGVIEIFDVTNGTQPDFDAVTNYDLNFANNRTRFRVDGRDPSSLAPRLTLFDGTANSEVAAVTLDGANGTMMAHNGAGAASVTITGGTGNLDADGTGTFGTGANTVTLNSGGASGDVAATGDVNADGAGLFGTGANTVNLNNAASGDVTATGAGSFGSGANTVTINSASSGSVAGTGSAAFDGNGVFGTGGNTVTLNNAVSGDVDATGDVNAVGAGNFGTGANTVVLNNAASGDVTASNDLNAGGDVNANGAGSFGTGVNTVSINNASSGSVTATGSAQFNGSGGFGTGANTVNINNLASGNVTATGAGSFGTSGTFGTGPNTVSLNTTSMGEVVATGDITADNITAMSDFITNGSLLADLNVVAGNGGANQITLDAATGDVTLMSGNVLTPAGDMLAGADPTAGNVGINLAGATGLLTGNSLTSAASFTGNGAAGGSNVLDLFDQSNANVLVSGGEKGGAAPDGTGYLSVFDSAGVEQLILDSEVPSVTVGAGASAISFDGTNGTGAIGSGATGISFNAVSGASSFGTGAMGISLDSSAGTFTVGGGANAVGVDGVNGIVAVGTGANLINLNGATGIASIGSGATGIAFNAVSGASSFGTGATAISLDSTAATFGVGSGANAVGFDGANGTGTIGSGATGISFNAVSGATSFGTGAMGISLDSSAATFAVGGGANAITMDGVTGILTTPTLNTTGNMTATGDITAGNGGNTVVLDAATGGVTAVGSVVAGSGGNAISLDAATGNITAPGNMISGSGANTVTLDGSNGNVTATGDVSGDNVSATTNVSAGVDVMATNDVISTDGRLVAQTPGAAVEVFVATADGSGHGTVAVSDVTGLKSLVTMGRDPASGVGMDDGILEVYSDGASTIQLLGNIGDVAGLSKSFLQPHPNDPSLMIKYRCLEGPENGLYSRGTAKMVDGFVRVELPESFRLAASKNGLSVHLTPMGDCAGLYAPIAELTRDGFVVRELFDGRHTVQISWVVNGLRRGMEEHKAIIPNTAFRPTISDRPFLPALPGLQDVMIKSGLLNSDGTPNQDAANENGTVLKTLEQAKDDRRNARLNKRK